jgi:predicted aconitase
MEYTQHEKDMLKGSHGEAARLAMVILSELGSIYRAKRMIKISQAHIDMTLYMVDAGVEFAEKMAALGGKFSVPTQLNPASIDLERHEQMRVPAELLEKSKRLEKAYLEMGAIPTWTCAPYQQGMVPCFGEQIAWGESNAVAFANSVLGARTERYADLTDICAAITGCVPEMGLHLEENRKAKILIKLEGISQKMFDNSLIYPLIGFLFGEIANDKIAAIQNMPLDISTDQLKSFSAAAASSGAVGLFHILGVTPEALNIAACFNCEKPEKEVIITPFMIKDAEKRLTQTTSLDPDLIILGCPHYSLNEFKNISKLMGNRKVNTSVCFWIFTSRKTHREINEIGILDNLNSSGIQVFTDGCPLQYPKENWDFSFAMSDSVKFANYCFSQTSLEVIPASTKSCVESAISGKTRKIESWS